MFGPTLHLPSVDETGMSKQTFAPQQTTFKVSSNVARYESIGALGSDRPLPITKLPISQGFKFLELDDIQPTDVHATVDGIPKSFKTETFDNSFGGVRLDSDPRTVHLNMFTAQAFGEARVSVRPEVLTRTFGLLHLFHLPLSYYSVIQF